MFKEHPKVFFTYSALESCWAVRCLIPLQAGAWDGDRTSYRSDRIDNETKAKAILDADIVVFHRANDQRSLEIAKLLRKQSKKIVLDNDDSFAHVDSKKWERYLKEVNYWLNEFVKFADLVTVSTEFLANEYRPLNPNVVVLKNCVDPDMWPEEPQRNETDIVRIGLVGSVTLNDDYKPILPYLEKLKDRKDVKVVLFALPRKNEDTILAQKYYQEDYQFWDKMNIEWHPFVPRADYEEALDNLRLDLMLIPRADDYFNRCKSNLKFLEASMLEIPVIAQGFPDGQSPYQDPKDSKFMSIIPATMPELWEVEAEVLIKDKIGRREMGKRAKKYVIENYQISKHIWRWEKVYKELLK